jgi:hypothetical protein
MRADLLHVIAVVSNPIRWQSRIKLYRDFEAHMLASGVRLTTVECAYGERPFELMGTPGVNYVHVRANSLLWIKEPLINIGLSRLPPDWQYAAWIDADVVFRQADWAAETVHALQQYPVVQPWSDCLDLGPNGELMETHRAFCRQVHEDQPVVQGPNATPGPYRFGHPGYGWAATRTFLEATGGLLETAGLGAADHHMALGLIGKAADSIPGGIHPNYRADVMRWQARADHAAQRGISYVNGVIEHAFHGAKPLRQYADRWNILIDEEYDPVEDTKRNTWGVLELAGNKPRLQHRIDRYFRQRNEDSTTL